MNAMRNLSKLFVLASLSVAAASCGDVARSGRAPVFLVIESLGGIAGGTSDTKAVTPLYSDVQRLDTKPDPCSTETPCPTLYSDNGEVVLHLSVKDISSPTTPSSNNQVTLSRYHVTYRRADGRNTPGVDVPYGFDGAVTVTVPVSGNVTAGIELVRHDAKAESPLVQLINNPQIITTLAEVTFYGQDLVGNEIQATGTIQIDFGNFADR